MALQSLSKQKRIKAVHQKVKLFRSNEPFFSVFMWGINYTVSELNRVNIPVMLMPDDFKAHCKIRVDNYLYNKDNMPSHFKIKVYCPLVFRNFRERFSVDDSTYSNSLSKEELRGANFRGKSGARFLVSSDKQFVVKLVSSETVEQMHSILKSYHQYVVECRGETLLPQFLGMYRLTVSDEEHYIVVMKNVIGGALQIHKKYDLKGSTVDRQATEKERLVMRKHSTKKHKHLQEEGDRGKTTLPTLKDKDFIQEEVVLHIGDQERERLLTILKNDVNFLTSLNLMDYSLLVGIHDVNRGTEPELSDTELDEEENGEGDVDSPDDDPSSPMSDGDQLPEIFKDTSDILSPELPSPGPHVTFAMPEVTLPKPTEFRKDFYAIPSSEGSDKREIYFVGLIDILTNYGLKKRTASLVKQARHGPDAEISTVRPDQYASRLVEFFSKSLR